MMNNEAIDAYFLFIAEMLGNFVAGSGNKQDKINCGKKGYIGGLLHELDLTTEEGQKDLHENIWLERVYEQLDLCLSIPSNPNTKIMRNLATNGDTYDIDEEVKPSVPIELDATSSMLQIIGVLLNDKRLMEMTNVIGDTLEDAWKVSGLVRKKVKSVMTPKLYGSSSAPEVLWKKDKMKFTAKDTALVSKELQTGAFGLANTFKDFIINNCNPSAEMEIKIGDDEFGIYCNKFRNVGEMLKAYNIWDSVDAQYNIILHTDTKKVPDLEQFRLFFMTLLIHNLDSQIMDAITEKLMDKYGWGLPIHDAVVCSPAAAADIRIWYGEELVKIHNNRKYILNDYFKSIGINALAIDEWEKVKSMIVPFTGDLEKELSMPLK